MSDEAKFLDGLERASIDTVVQLLRGLHEWRRALDDGVRSRDRRKAVGGAGDYLFGLARLCLNNYNELLRFHSQQFDYLTDRLHELVRAYRLDDPDYISATLIMTEPVGEVARAGFVVENVRGTPADVSFSNPEFVRDDGRRFVAPVEIVPRTTARAAEAREVGAGERRRFELRVPLKPDLFAAGRRYSAELYVISQGRIAGCLAIALRVGEEAPAPRPRRARRRPGRGRVRR